MVDYDFDLAIIGGGPAGYAAAIRAAQLNVKVCLVERHRMGGTCLNAGCIPTKALHRSAEVYQLTKKSEEFGISYDNPAINWERVQGRKAAVVDQLVNGVDQLMKTNGITVIKGDAKLAGANELSVVKEDDEAITVSADKILISAGSKSAELPIEGADLPGVLDSTALLNIDHIPLKLAVIGGGVIGIEFAAIFNEFGSEVTVIEFLPRILAQLDSDISKRLVPMMKRTGVEILTSAKVMKIEELENRLMLKVSTPKGDIQIDADQVLLAVGRQPAIDGLGLETAGVDYDRSGIKVDQIGQTNIANIYAVGDVTGGIMLAHAASHQGIAAVEHMLANDSERKTKTIPGCVFAFPEIAFAGVTEEEAKERGIPYQTGKFLFGANGKALTLGEGEGFIKVISDENDRLIGVHILGPHASDLIQEGVLAIDMKIPAEDLIGTIHAHPTLSEAFVEAVMDLKGISLHSAPARKR